MKRFILIFVFISTFQVSAQKVKILQDAIFIEYGKIISNGVYIYKINAKNTSYRTHHIGKLAIYK